MKLEPFQGIFGLPPSTYISDDQILNTMPVAEIIPGKPSFSAGLTVFRVVPDWDAYMGVLSKLGFQIERPIRIAFLADNFPTDSFTNDYGETFLQKVTDVASEGMAQLAQMTGARTGTEGLANLSQAIKQTGEEVGGVLGTLVGGAGTVGLKTSDALKRLQRTLSDSESNLSQMVGSGAQVIDKLFAGHRVDFPNIWRNSGFQPSYTMTIRLYNPNPGSDEATERYIIGPLAVLLALGTPRSTDGQTYNWPFFHKIRSTGIWALDPGVITNISVIKGGDQQQIAYNQRLGMVDVRIDFNSLYTSMLVEEGDTNIETRPTLRSYLNIMKEEVKPKFTRKWLRANVGMKAGITSKFGIFDQVEDLEPNILNNQAAARQAQTVTDLEEENRSPEQEAAIQSDLEAKNKEIGFGNN